MSDGFPKGTVFYSGHGQAGNWSDAANWTGGVTPNLTTNTGLLLQTNATLNTNFSIFQLMALGNESITVNATLSTLSNNQCNSFMVCDNAVATFTPTAVLNDAGGLIVGVNAVGTLVAQGNGAVHARLNTVGTKIGQHANSTGLVTINDSVWNNTERMFVGLTGVGTVAETGASHVNVGYCLGIGVNAGGNGLVSLAGASTLNVGTFAVIGGNGVDTDTPAPSGTGIGTGTLQVQSGSAFSVAQSLTVSAGSAVTLAGGSVNVAYASTGVQVLAGGMLSGNGSVTVNSGHVSAGGITDNGTVQASGGALVLNSSLSGSGAVLIAAGATLAINGNSIGVPSISFAGSNGTLSLAHGIADHATITGFAAGDSILMAGVDHISWNGSTDMLTLNAGTTVVDTIHFAGTYASDAFTLSQTSVGAMIGLTPSHH